MFVFSACFADGLPILKAHHFSKLGRNPTLWGKRKPDYDCVLSDIQDGEWWRQRWIGKPDPHAEAEIADFEGLAAMDIDDGRSEDGVEEKQAAPAAARPAGPHPLLARRGTLALALNIDWYQQFAQGGYSMGAIYMTVLNLPREERYLAENMILVGVLPGPRETSRTQLQGALKPLVEELRMLRNEGFKGRAGVRMYAFYFHTVSDIPAARMTCGFARETSRRGCPYCRKAFPKREGCTHVDWRPWNPRGRDLSKSAEEALPVRRQHDQHIQTAREWADTVNHLNSLPRRRKDSQPNHADTTRPLDGSRHSWAAAIRGVQTKHFKKHGVRWSVLNDLGDIDCIRCMPIDVMHNILLGTCKHIMAVFTGHKDSGRKRKTPEERKESRKQKQENKATKEKDKSKDKAERERQARQEQEAADAKKRQADDRAKRQSQRQSRLPFLARPPEDPEREDGEDELAEAEASNPDAAGPARGVAAPRASSADVEFDSDATEEDEVQPGEAEADSDESSSADDEDEPLVHLLSPAQLRELERAAADAAAVLSEEALGCGVA